jgi:hypothetical protein
VEGKEFERRPHAMMARCLIGGLVNIKVIEALGGKRPGAVDEDRIVAAWTRLYRLDLENPT